MADFETYETICDEMKEKGFEKTDGVICICTKCRAFGTDSDNDYFGKYILFQMGKIISFRM